MHFALRLTLGPPLITAAIGAYALWVAAGASLWLTRLIYDEWRLLQAVVLILVGGSMSVAAGKDLARNNRRTALVAMLFVLAFTCVLQSEWPGQAALDLILQALLVMAAYGLSLCWYSHPAVARTGMACFALTLIPACMLLVVAVSEYFATRHWVGWHGAFANPRYLDDFVLAGLFALWGMQATQWRIALWVAQTLLGALCFCGLLLDGARGVVLAITSGILLAIAACWSRRREMWIPLTSLAFGGGLFALLPITAVGEPALVRQSTSGRLELMKLGWRYFQAEPIFGIGGMAWGEFKKMSELYEGILRTSIHHPHNILVQWIVEWGVLGWLTIALLLAALMAVYKQRRRIPIVALAGLVAVVINTLVSGAAVYPHTQLAYVWIVGWAWASACGSDPLEFHSSRISISRLLSCCLVAITIGFTSLNVLAIRDSIGRSFEPERKRYPRYFESGYELFILGGARSSLISPLLPRSEIRP